MGERADAMRDYTQDPNYVAQATERDLDVAASDITPTTSDDPEEIRENIAQTRAEMSVTIDAIQEKLDPDRLKAQVADAVHEQVDAAKQRVREATIGRAERMVSDLSDSARDAGSGFLGTIKDNPIPAAMAALGIAWLWTKRRSGSSDRGYDYRGDRYAFEARRPYGYGTSYTRGAYDSPYSSTWDSYGARGAYPGGYAERDYRYERGDDQSLRDRAGTVVGQARDTVADATSQVRDRVGDVAGTAQERVGQFTEQAQERVGEFADRAQERFGEWTDQAQYGVRQVRSRFDQTLDENPLAVSAAAIALGLAVGMSIPETPWEDRLMGEARDSVMDKAQSAAQETMEKVQAVVGQVQETAKDAAQDAAQQMKQTAQQTAQQQGLVSGGQQGQPGNQNQQRSQQGASQGNPPGMSGQQRSETASTTGTTGTLPQTSSQGGTMTGRPTQSPQESQRHTTP